MCELNTLGELDPPRRGWSTHSDVVNHHLKKINELMSVRAAIATFSMCTTHLVESYRTEGRLDNV